MPSFIEIGSGVLAPWGRNLPFSSAWRYCLYNRLIGATAQPVMNISKKWKVRLLICEIENM